MHQQLPVTALAFLVPRRATTPWHQLLLAGLLPSVVLGCSAGSSSTGTASSWGGAPVQVVGATGGVASGTSGANSGGASTNGGAFIGNGGASTNGGAFIGNGGASTNGGAFIGNGGASTNGGAFNGNGGASTSGGTLATGGSAAGGTKGDGGAIVTGGTRALGGAATAGTKSNGGGTTTGGGSSSRGGATTGGLATGGASAVPNDLWIAPNGSDSNVGTEASPMATLSAAHAKVTAGQTIWVKAGTYSWSSTVKLTKSGSATNPINVFAAAGARPVFDFSAQTCGDSAARGIQITGTYWHLKGFDVQKAGDNCIHIGGSYNTVEWVITHNCCDSGLQITADTASDPTRGAYNTVLNCDSFENYDVPTGGENADGFSPKLHIGPGNVFRGCRSWNNADDGYDLFASDDKVTIENCWAFLNGVLADGSGTTQGDGNGFKLGGAATAGDAYEGGAPHQVTNCFAFENTACGFTRNNNTSVPVLTTCGGRSDGKGEYCSLTNASPVSFTMTGAQAKAIARNADGSLPAIK